MTSQFSCQACGATFPAQQALMEHARIAHPQSQAETHQHQHFACEACGTDFHTVAELEEHATHSHPI